MHVSPARENFDTPIGKRAPVERIQQRLIRAAADRCAEAYRLLIANTRRTGMRTIRWGALPNQANSGVWLWPYPSRAISHQMMSFTDVSQLEDRR